jgi:tetratricopeptide (TPR) repeat protein
MKFAGSAGWIFFGVMSVASGAYAQNSITALDVDGTDDGSTIIKVELAQPLAHLPAGAGFTLSTPPRIVLDFPDTANGLGKSAQDFVKGGVRSVSLAQTKESTPEESTRLVIYLDRMSPNNIKLDGNRLLIAMQGRNPHLNPLPEGEEAIALSPSGGKLDRGLAGDDGSNTLRLAEAKQDTQKPPVKSEPEARKPAEAKTQVKKPAALQPQAQAQPVSAPANASLESLLQEADALIKAGRAADAYNLLEPKEADYSGELVFDYLLGIAALDSGKPDRATIAFERVLAVNPNFAGARLDLARAYFAMGSDDLAKNEFGIVLAQKPPEPTAAVIRKYLEAIDQRQQDKIQQVAGYLEMSMGHDDNITAATPDNIGGVAGILGMTKVDFITVAPSYQPTGSSLHYAGMYTGISGGINFNRLVSEENGISIFAGADVKQRVYNNVAPMNNLSLDLHAGVGLAKGDNSYRVTGTFGQYRQSGFIAGTNSFRDTTGLSAEWRRSFGAYDQMIWSLGISQPRYLATPAQDTRQTLLSASWLHIFEGNTKPLVFANLSRSIDRASQSVNAATGANMGRTNTGALAHFQFTPWDDTDFFISGGLTVRQDDSPGARSPGLVDFYARDETQNLTFGLTTRPWEKWTIKGAVGLTNNRSNLSLYQYRRRDSSVSLRRDF